jgi:hypothetical protein
VLWRERPPTAACAGLQISKDPTLASQALGSPELKDMHFDHASSHPKKLEENEKYYAAF